VSGGIQKGSTFLSSEDSPGGRHLYFVLTAPEKGSVVIANISRTPCHSGATFVVDVGDHPWVQTKSHLRFREARLAPVLALEQAISSRIFEPQKAASATLTRKIAEALECSAHVKGEVVSALSVDLNP
jgi:hypothetical protein